MYSHSLILKIYIFMSL